MKASLRPPRLGIVAGMTDTGSLSGSARGSTSSCDGLTLTQAAARLGVTERTLRTYIKEGNVLAEKVIGSKGVAVYRVYLDDPVSDPVVDRRVDPVVIEDDPPADPLPDPNAEAFIRHIAQLEQTVLELSGRLGFYQAQIQHLRGENTDLKERIALLEAPKPDPEDPAPVETTNQSGEGQNEALQACERPAQRPWWRFWTIWRG